MHKTTAPKQEPPATAPEPPAIKPPRSPYGCTETALLNRLLAVSSDRERAFLREFIHECLESTDNVMECAFRLGKRAFGATGWLPDPQEEEDYAVLRPLYMMMNAPEDWKGRLLRKLALWNEHGNLNLPEDAVEATEQELTDFQNSIEDAIKVLRGYPTVLTQEIRKAIEKHPEIVE